MSTWKLKVHILWSELLTELWLSKSRNHVQPGGRVPLRFRPWDRNSRKGQCSKQIKRRVHSGEFPNHAILSLRARQGEVSVDRDLHFIPYPTLRSIALCAPKQLGHRFAFATLRILDSRWRIPVHVPEASVGLLVPLGLPPDVYYSQGVESYLFQFYLIPISFLRLVYPFGKRTV